MDNRAMATLSLLLLGSGLALAAGRPRVSDEVGNT
jgi:hypothetical protein